MKLGKCKFCGKHESLVRAHIIPESFYEGVIDERQGAKILALDGYPSKSHKGEYDDEMLCVGCEARFSPFDDYAKKFFAQTPNPIDVHEMSNWDLWEIKSYDYTKLKLFFLSLLWRASETTRPFFNKISLGPYSSVVKKMIDDGSPGGDSDFLVYLMKYKDSVGMNTLMSPSKNRVGHGFVNVFHLHGFKAAIHIGKSNMTSNQARHLGLTSEGSMWIPITNLESAQEFRDIEKIVMNNIPSTYLSKK